MKRALTLTALALTACGAAEPTGPAAPSASADAGAAAAPKVVQQQIQNLGYFDVATLFPVPPVVTIKGTSTVYRRNAATIRSSSSGKTAAVTKPTPALSSIRTTAGPERSTCRPSKQRSLIVSTTARVSTGKLPFTHPV